MGIHDHQDVVFDVIVIGGGHAGIEAVNSACKIAKRVLLITLSAQKIGLTPCNPSIGGSAKGIVVCEISALGGLMNKIADEATLQMKLLNQSNGPAVQSMRAQIDKLEYPKIALRELIALPNLVIIEDQVVKLIIKNKQVMGVQCRKESKKLAKTVIITTGTFMNSLILQGQTAVRKASDNQKTTQQLSQQLRHQGLKMIRLRTGTPPRLDEATINYEKCQRMLGTNDKNIKFSFFREKTNHHNISCWLTYTNELTHQIIAESCQQSKLFWKANAVKGPRYCPSIENKVFRFSDKKRHQLFLEPESLKSASIYLQGFSTSLAKHQQEKAVHTICGLEKARIIKYGYAIEYDAFKNTELTETLELKKIRNLFSAGQANCTSGYEEAAAQGLIAGVNAALRAIESKKKFILQRNEAYIGVLISDLLTKNITEPYRLLTGLAEYRLFLRSGNAQLRLFRYAKKFNLISQDKYTRIILMEQNIKELKKIIKTTSTSGKNKLINQWLIQNQQSPLHATISFAKLLRRPQVTIYDILPFMELDKKYSKYEYQETEVQIKYEHYLKIQNQQIKEMQTNVRKKLPNKFNYFQITGLSRESQENLQKIQPSNFAQLLLIPGVRLEDAIRIKIYLKSMIMFKAVKTVTKNNRENNC